MYQILGSEERVATFQGSAAFILNDSSTENAALSDKRGRDKTGRVALDILTFKFTMRPLTIAYTHRAIMTQ